MILGWRLRPRDFNEVVDAKRGLDRHDERVTVALRLELEIVDPAGEPISGWLGTPQGERVPFQGLLALLAALESARAGATSLPATVRGHGGER